MLQPEFDQRLQRGIQWPGQQGLHARIDLGAVVEHLLQRGPRDQAALGPWVACAHALVIGVEQHAKRGVERRETRLVRLQHKGLEEPSGMRQMPFDRARIGHGLHAAILGRQRRGQRQADAAQAGVGLGQRVGGVGRRPWVFRP
ncbi:hypothetical protein D3C85_1450500 [compost metagenome]